jgi:pimeloyl-ACP methyl ester carboxylesterase
MDPSGLKPLDESDPKLQRCFNRHRKDYAELSSTPDRFEALVADLGLMQRTQPNYSVAQLLEISVPVAIVQSEHDEFILREHAEYLAANIPHAELIFLEKVSHFAPLQRPDVFNAAALQFLHKVCLGKRKE